MFDGFVADMICLTLKLSVILRVSLWLIVHQQACEGRCSVRRSLHLHDDDNYESFLTSFLICCFLSL